MRSKPNYNSHWLSLSAVFVLVLVTYFFSCRHDNGTRLIFLQKGSLGIGPCMKKIQDTCFFGSGFLSDCESSCAVATVPEFEDLRIAFEYEATGNLVDVVSGAPVEGMEVILILSNRTRHMTRSHSDGSFTITVKPDTLLDDGQPSRIEQDFGIMETVLEGNKIILVSDFSQEFRDSHPDLNYQLLDVSELDNEAINLESPSK